MKNVELIPGKLYKISRLMLIDLVASDMGKPRHYTKENIGGFSAPAITLNDLVVTSKTIPASSLVMYVETYESPTIEASFYQKYFVILYNKTKLYIPVQPDVLFEIVTNNSKR